MRTLGKQGRCLLLAFAFGTACVAPRDDRRVVPAAATPTATTAPVDAAPLVEPAPVLQPVIAPPPPQQAAPAPAPAPLTAAPATPAPVVHVLEPAMRTTTIAVCVGQELVFANDDSICHGLFSSSVPNTFDLGMLQPGCRASVRFAHQGTVRVYCSLHQHPKLTVLVLPAGATLPSTPGR